MEEDFKWDFQVYERYYNVKSSIDAVHDSQESKPLPRCSNGSNSIQHKESDAHSYFSTPSYFSTSQLNDLLSHRERCKTPTELPPLQRTTTQRRTATPPPPERQASDASANSAFSLLRSSGRELAAWNFLTSSSSRNDANIPTDSSSWPHYTPTPSLSSITTPVVVCSRVSTIPLLPSRHTSYTTSQLPPPPPPPNRQRRASAAVPPPPTPPTEHHRLTPTTKAPAAAAAVVEERGGSFNGLNKSYFYDLAETLAMDGNTVIVERVQANRPQMRSAAIKWDSEAEESPLPLPVPSSPPHQLPETASDLDAKNVSLDEVPSDAHMQVVIIKAKKSTEAVSERPPPLDPRTIYRTVPILYPVLPNRQQRKRRKGSSCFTAKRSKTKPVGEITADEVVEVDFSSGRAAADSITVDLVRMHFLSGHNTMLTVANTAQCTTLAEDAVSTMISSVYHQAEQMKPSFISDISISAYAVRSDGCVVNLLPTSYETQQWETIRIGTNPMLGALIVNRSPVSMWSPEEALFLSRALIQNARHLRVDPYADPETVVHVTLLLRQNRVPQVDESQHKLATNYKDASGAKGKIESQTAPSNTQAKQQPKQLQPSSMHVYLSSMHIVWVGNNLDIMHQLLTQRPSNLWPLYRQPYGGQCRTAVISFVDREDDLQDSKEIVEFSQFMRSFKNLPPRSGSVLRFLKSTAETVDHLTESVAVLKRMRRDASKLLTDPTAEPDIYAINSCDRLNHLPQIGAYRVIIVSAETALPQHSSCRRPSAPPARQENLTPAPPPTRPHRKPLDTLAVSPQSRSLSRSASRITEVVIPLPSFLRLREAAKSNPATVLDNSLRSSLMHQRAFPPRIVSHDSLSYPCSSRLSFESSPRVPPATAPSTVATPAGAPQDFADASEGQSSSTFLGGGELIKTGCLIFTRPASSPAQLEQEEAIRGVSSSEVVLRLPPVLSSSSRMKGRAHSSVKGGRSKKNGRHHAVEQRFELDEVVVVPDSNATHCHDLLHGFAIVRDIYTAFVHEQLSVAVMATHCSGDLLPFAHHPIWATLERIMIAVTEDHARTDAPSQFTVFGSLLKGNRIVRDLAEAGCAETDEHPVDGAEALVGASPLFGSILYQTRGIDLFDASEVEPVLSTMLRYADDAAGGDMEAYVVVTAVQKVTMRLASDAAGPTEQHWDANFSSCTFICTRNTMQLYSAAVEEMDATEFAVETSFPFGLLSEIVGGYCKSVSLLTIDRDDVSLRVVKDAMEAQQVLGQVQNELPRSGLVGTYVKSCLSAADALRQSCSSPSNPTDEDVVVLLQASKLESLAQQHADYLTNPNIRGFIIYPTPTREDIQTLFYSSTRFSNSSSGAGALSQLQLQPQPTVQTPDGERPAPVVDETQRPRNSTRHHFTSAAPLSRDSGFVAHSLLLLLREPRSSPPAAPRNGYSVSVVSRGEVQVSYTGPTQRCSVAFAFDDIVEMSMANCTARPSGSRAAHPSSGAALKRDAPSLASSGLNSESLSSSQLLHWATAGYVVGYNSAVVMQETLAAQQGQGCERMIHHTLQCCMSSSPDEAAFFLSASYLDFDSAVDLTNAAAVKRASARGSTVESRSVPQVGQSPLTGIFLSSSKLHHISGKSEMTAALNSAFDADAAITAAGAPPHFLVLSFWQKLFVASENDVCISSFLFIITRGGPGIMAEALARSSMAPCGQLLHYALRGSCYTISGCSMTDAERRPPGVASNNPNELLNSLSFYQNSLNACTGRPLKYNSVSDAVKQHQSDMEKAMKSLDKLKSKASSRGEDKLTDADRRSRVAMKLLVHQLNQMIKDEEKLIRHGMHNLSAVPPFYDLDKMSSVPDGDDGSGR